MHLHKFSARVSSAALFFLVMAGPAVAENPASSPSNEASVADVRHAPNHSTKAAPEEPKKICRTIDTLSSRLKSKKVCMTREQWRNAKYN